MIALVAPASAAAAPFELGAGRDASAVADPAGTAHIVFDSSPSIPDRRATYCRLPRGATACDVRIEMPLQYADDPWIFRRASDGALIVLQVDGGDYDPDPSTYLAGGAWIRVSTDGGATFSAPALIATGIGAPNAIELAPDGQALLTLLANDDGVVFRRLPLAGPDPRTLRIDARSSLISSALGVRADGRMVAVAELPGVRGTGWRSFAGGEPFDINAWRRGGALRHSLSDPTVVSGPRGVFLLVPGGISDQVLDREPAVSLRAFDFRRQRWRAGRFAFGDAEFQGETALAQDAAGRLHLARGNLLPRGTCLMYARTGTRARSWFGRTTRLFVTRDESREPHGIQLAAAPDGRGFAVWHDRRDRMWAIPLRQAPGRYRPIANPFDRPDCPRR